ncbi:MAG: recombination mediator RecR [Desulfobacterales bacterium]|jgi:recombination protein RecR|nr:recombination protein RecR [Desulfobacter sp.]MDP6681963.1 recombination mediator RecR [Desulfobacterales bacterium]MDP6808261.1 recombination mediator RecR [Desulfobacterales bacterium]|tara:strand:- start:21769 stop:22368 length:600 start_codon:yes stop_codon:yes gene_type:complete
MGYYPTPVVHLIQNISKLPGIGEKTAERLAIYLLGVPRKEAEQLAGSILEVKDKIRLCSRCFSLSDNPVCDICSNPTRNETLLCVVEQPMDMVAIEKSGSFLGVYHVLQGVLSPMAGVGPDHIRIRELISRIEEGTVKEVVIATGTDVEGEATASYLAERLRKRPIKVSRIASGIPMGGELQYVDQVTLKRAMEKRHDL